eukprot:CAMPEP_0116135314 /NCGR_PEP_ID=MMETSP0329-20121206/11125_1 /TAXON_ID=697910 /ORGANISM="Pseudo-nitzschia arenysensis, Strain B593" /LENGTH=513 /DNA_ID=CAMNT_0003630107 /DNA_START=206 /DNA_END=1747 /DNA_ORIENTATION=-
MFDFIGKNPFGKNKDDGKGDGKDSNEGSPPPFTFGHRDAELYQYPNLYDEANEMLQVSMLIYSLTDIRSLAKDPERKAKLKSPELILDLPLSLRSCMQVLDDNYNIMKELFGEAEHVNTMNSMNIIHARFQKNRELVSSSTNTEKSLFKFNPLASIMESEGSIEVEEISPLLTHFGDDNCDVDMVYAIGFDQLRKRVTVAFRGSVTATDFQKDAMMSLNKQPNPVKSIDSNQSSEIGIHHGFYDYLLRTRRDGKSKFQEIMGHVEALFSDGDRRQNYKLYVTGHSLGGALATLFSLHAASAAASGESSIPSPISCISVASPRVGDRDFQSAFCRLEELGYLRHLRVANDRDPVTMMPSASAKKVWVGFSPLAYIAFSLIDKQFGEKEHFYHTGIKLRLTKDKWELAFLGKRMISSECGEVVDDDAETVSSEADLRGSNASLRSALSRSLKSAPLKRESKKDSFQQAKVPDVSQHLGSAYIDNLCSVERPLLTFTLNDLYKEKALPVFLSKTMK